MVSLASIKFVPDKEKWAIISEEVMQKHQTINKLNQQLEDKEQTHEILKKQLDDIKYD